MINLRTSITTGLLLLAGVQALGNVAPASIAGFTYIRSLGGIDE